MAAYCNGSAYFYIVNGCWRKISLLKKLFESLNYDFINPLIIKSSYSFPSYDTETEICYKENNVLVKSKYIQWPRSNVYECTLSLDFNW